MRLLFPVLAVALLAGCAVPGDTTPTVTPPLAQTGWSLDCKLGAVEQALGTPWAQSCVARASHTKGSKAEMWIAVNPTDVNNVIIGSKDLNPEASNKCVWNGLGVTHDGGKTWKDVIIGGKFADRKPGDPLYGYSCNADPDFQFTKDGAVHYGVEMYNVANTGPCNPEPLGCGFEQGYKIMLATSKDGGDTWPEIITYQPDLFVVTDYSRMTVNPVSQAIIEAIGSDGGQGCHVLVSPDGGKTATFTVVATQYGLPCNSGAGTAIAVSPKGVVTLVGGQVTQPGEDPTASGPAQPIVVRSTDDGRTWIDSNPGFTYKPINGFKESKYRVGSVIELSYDLTGGPNRGTLYAVYAAADRDGSDIFARTSKDDGKTWTQPVMVNDDAEGSHQWMSNVAVAGDGSVHVFYMDKRYDPEHKLIDITHAVSTDGGKTWVNERVTTKSFDGDLGKHQEGYPFIGDYLGVACVANDCWAGFPDANLGDAPSIAAAHVHKST